MRRIVLITLAVVVAAAFATVAGGASGGHDDGRSYSVELDNAFGLIHGADLKIAGVRAGKITTIKLDRATNRAIVGFKITRNGFGSLRTDVRCQTRPQSLIGEYFLDCLPGTAPTELKPGTRIPVTATSTTVAPDLVNDILRRPYRERLAIIINELGAGVAGNGENLNAAIRRGAPALQETDKVLAMLARQNRVIADLTQNADQVVGALAANRKDVGRWVVAARNTAVASAARKQDIALGFRRLPGFLEQLRPTMAALGATADAQTPALRNLSASAGQLERLFRNLVPFSDANVPALRALARASVVGGQAAKAATPVARQLAAFAAGTPELGKNLALVLQHLDDPAHAIEDDPRAARASGRPAPTGYTGLEALLQYAYDQAQSTNIYDRNEHILKIGVIPPTSPCAQYADAARAKAVADECAARLGPNQPGVNFRDATVRPGDTATRRAHRTGDGAHRDPAATPAPGAQAPAANGDAPTGPSTATPATPKKPTLDLPPLLPGLPDPPPITLPGLDGLGKRLGSSIGVGRGVRSGAAAGLARGELAAIARSREAGALLLAYLMDR